jgi:hypothetical protein
MTVTDSRNLCGRCSQRHGGTDLRAADGTAVVSSCTGKVAEVRCQVNPKKLNRLGIPSGWGWTVKVQCDSGTEVRYAHLDNPNQCEPIKECSKGPKPRPGCTSNDDCDQGTCVDTGGRPDYRVDGTLLPSVGARVVAGFDVIGLSDSSGGVSGPHLHMECGRADCEKLIPCEAFGRVCDATKGGKCVDSLPPSPPAPPTASTFGDPHLITFDGLAYDFQALGEFVVVKSLDDNFEIQARTKPVPGSRRVSLNGAIALRLITDRIGIYTSAAPWLRVNGVPVLSDGPVSLSGGGTLNVSGAASLVGLVTAAWPDGSKLQVTRSGDSFHGDYLDMVIGLGPTRSGRVLGMLGDFDGESSNDLTLRYTSTVMSLPLTSQQLYGEFGESWRLKQSESLFDYGPGETTDTYTDRTFPDELATVASVPDTSRVAALAVCQQAGITDPTLLDACVLDVALTGNPNFANLPAGTTAPQQAVVVEGACPPIAGEWSWSAGGTTTFVADGAITRFPVVDQGTWTCSDGVYRLEWNSGETDILALSSDGITLSGHDNLGNTISGVLGASASTTTAIDDFAALDSAKWSLGGSAVWDAATQRLQLTDAAPFESGRAYYGKRLVVDAFHVEFDYDMSGGTGADGLAFSLVRDPQYPSTSNGACIDLCGATGFAVKFDSFSNPAAPFNEPPGEHVGIVVNGGEVAYAPTTVRGQHHVAIDLSALGEMRVAIDGSQVIDLMLPGFTPFAGVFGFTAATGGATDNQSVDNVVFGPPVGTGRSTIDGLEQARGAAITFSTPTALGYGAIGMIGGTSNETGYDGSGSTIFRDDVGPAGTIDFAEITTTSPVTLAGVTLYVAADQGENTNRGVIAFAFRADVDGDGIYESSLVGGVDPHDDNLANTYRFAPITARRFRAEFTQSSGLGARIVELDGIAGIAGPQQCVDARPVVPSGCTNVALTGTATASGSLPGSTAAAANDGNLCTRWGSGGFPPASWTVDLGASLPLDGVTLVPEMTPNGSVSHTIDVSTNGVDFTTVTTVDQTMNTQVIYPIALGTVTARYVRVRTLASPSWVSWGEVAVYTCP